MIVRKYIFSIINVLVSLVSCSDERYCEIVMVECDLLFISLLIAVVELGFTIQTLQLEDEMQHMDPGLYLLVSFTE